MPLLVVYLEFETYFSGFFTDRYGWLYCTASIYCFLYIYLSFVLMCWRCADTYLRSSIASWWLARILICGLLGEYLNLMIGRHLLSSKNHILKSSKSSQLSCCQNSLFVYDKQNSISCKAYRSTPDKSQMRLCFSTMKLIAKQIMLEAPRMQFRAAKSDVKKLFRPTGWFQALIISMQS